MKESVKRVFGLLVVMGLVVLELFASGCGILPEPPQKKPALEVKERQDRGLFWFKVGVPFPPDKEPPTLRNVTLGLERSKFKTWVEERSGTQMLMGEFDDNGPALPEQVNIVVQAYAPWADGPFSYARFNGTVLHHFQLLLPEPREASCTTVFEGDFRAKISVVGESANRGALLWFEFPNEVGVELEVAASGIVSRWKFSGTLQIQRELRSIDCTIDHPTE